MSLTKLSLARNNYSPPGSLLVTSRLGTEKSQTFFYSVQYGHSRVKTISDYGIINSVTVYIFCRECSNISNRGMFRKYFSSRCNLHNPIMHRLHMSLSDVTQLFHEKDTNEYYNSLTRYLNEKNRMKYSFSLSCILHSFTIVNKYRITKGQFSHTCFAQCVQKFHHNQI
jgi:hypothetical protein